MLNRLFLIFFLILSFIFLILFLITSPAHAADVDYPYYENSGTCSKNYGTFCTSDKYPQSGPNELITPIDCGFYGYSDPQAHYSTQWRPWWTSEPQGNISYGNATIAATKHFTCPSTQDFKLDGCTASCVPKDDCSTKSGQQIHQRRQCGIASGINCQTTATPDSGDTSTIHCDSYAINWLDLNGTGTSDGQCELNISSVNRDPKGNGNFDAGDTPQSPSDPVSIYCDVTSTYTGQPAQTGTNAPSSSPPTNPSNPTTSTGIKPNSGTGTGTGSCPDGSNPVNGVCAMGGSCANGATMVNGECPSGTDTGNQTGTCTVGTAGCSPTGTCTVGTAGCSSTGTGGGTTGGTCDPTKSICDGSSDGSAPTGELTKPTKIENTVTESWWESEYEDGIVGIWDSHKTALNNTPFIQSLNQFKQGIPNTGSCPSFQLTFMQYSGSISPPCIIWPFLRAVFLFSTMMVCRRIVFGG